jgi:hypothetical protein
VRPPLGCWCYRLARQPTRCCLPLGLGCPAFPSVGGEEGGASSKVVPPPRGEDVVDSAAGGRTVGAVAADARRWNEYHVVAAVEGHELKTPETEHHPGLERLLETAHLELDGKLFVNTQQAPTWRANCRRSEIGGVPEPTSECRRVPQPRWVEREGEREGGKARRPETSVREVGIARPSCSSRAQVECACSRGLQASTQERERAASSERLSRPSPRAANPL